MSQEREGDHWWGKVSEQEDVNQPLKMCIHTKLKKCHCGLCFLSEVTFHRASQVRQELKECPKGLAKLLNRVK